MADVRIVIHGFGEMISTAIGSVMVNGRSMQVTIPAQSVPHSLPLASAVLFRLHCSVLYNGMAWHVVRCVRIHVDDLFRWYTLEMVIDDENAEGVPV